MMQAVVNNQVLMTFLIASIWIIPGIVFTLATNRKYKHRDKVKRLKKISRLFPQN